MNTNRSTDFKPLSVRRQIHDRANRAFTLTELLVVLGTLGILAVLLLPALASSTQPGSAKAFQCLNNMRQMAQAWTLYAEDNHDRLVNNWDTSPLETDLASNPPLYRSWVCDVMSWTLPPPDYCFNLAGMVQAPFYNYVNNVSVYKCPADNYLSPLQRSAGYTARPRSYSMNCFFGPPNPTSTSTGNEFFPWYRQFLKTGTIPNPSNLYVFLEEHPDGIDDGYFKDSANTNITSSADWPGGIWGNIPGSNHIGSGGFSFADGHSEMHKWKSTVCTILPVTYGPLPHSSLLSDPNAITDAQWLASHSSVLK